MKNQTIGISEELLKSAEKEFLQEGFAKASLRKIAAEANVSTSTIYTRFGDKLGLLHAIIAPTIMELKKYMQASLNEFSLRNPEVQEQTMVDASKVGHHTIIDIIYDNFSAMRLMTIMPIEAMRNELIDAFVETSVKQTMQYAESIGSDAFTTGRMTPQLLHIICTSYYEGIMETVSHEMSRSEAHEYMDKLSNFFNIGWLGIF